MKALPKDKKQRVKDAFKYALDVHTLKWAFNERPQDLAMFKILYISKDAVKEDEVHLSLELILILSVCMQHFNVADEYLELMNTLPN